MNAALSPRALLLLLGILSIQFLCFYWWAADGHFFSGDGLYYFSRQIDSLSELAHRFVSVDELYQYRPLTYVFFTFVLLPLFGNAPAPYHVAAYGFTTLNALLACLCVYYWAGKRTSITWCAVVFLLLNPVHFFPSFGPTYIDQWLSSFFYFVTLIILMSDISVAWVAAPAMFLLALCSKEHSVTLPAHAVLMFLATGSPIRDALKKTRNLWIVLGGFVLFQMVIRDGALYAPSGTNPNLQFGFSLERVFDLARGAKAALFYPEGLSSVARVVRWTALAPWFAILVLALRQKNKLALSGLAWFLIALLPIAFIQVAPLPRHYYLGVPGLAILFASVISSWRALVIATPVFALITVANVDLYARESWVAAGAKRTHGYLERIRTMVEDSGKPAFYVAEGGDPYFYWYIDGGAALPQFLHRDVSFSFAALNEPLPVVPWLENGVHIIRPSDGKIFDAFDEGHFPPRAGGSTCALVSEIVGTSADETDCSVIFRGRPLSQSSHDVVETPNGLPIFRVSEGIVTLARTTLILRSGDGLKIDRDVRLVPESADGVVLQIHEGRPGRFERLVSIKIAPGESAAIQHFVPSRKARRVVVRIDPGPIQNEVSDWLIWKSSPSR